MLYKVDLKIWNFTAFAASAVLVATLVSTQALAMTEEAEELRESANVLDPSIDAWILISGQLTSKRDVINFSRVCRFAYTVVKNNGAWERVAKKYMVSPEQLKDPSFFVKRKADKAARREIVRKEKDLPRYSHLGELFPGKRTGRIAHKQKLSRIHHKSDGLYD